MSAVLNSNPMFRRQLLSSMQALRSLVEPEGNPPPCEAVEWRIPHRLNAEAVERLRLFSAKLATGLQTAFDTLTGQPFTVAAEPVKERYAVELYRQVEQERPNNYYLPITAAAGKGHVGFMQVSLEAAGQLVGYVLRDPEAGLGKDERLSPLGETILQDALGSLADALAAGFAEYGQSRVEKTDALIYCDWPVRFSDLEDLCRFDFAAGCGQSVLTITLVVMDEVVAGIAGLTPPFGRIEDKKENPDRIVKRMHESPMEVTAMLSRSLMTLNDMMTLSVGDVVVLERKITEPLDIFVNGQPCFTAWPAACDGRYALSVAETKIAV